MPISRVVLAATLLAILTHAAPALTISAVQNPPTTSVLLARDVDAEAGSYLCDRGTGAASLIGQTFQLSTAAVLDRITLRVRPQTNVASSLVILYFGTFADGEAVDMDELLASEIVPLPPSLAVGIPTYLTFDLANQSLAAGKQYGFVLGFAGGDHPGEAMLDLLHLGIDGYDGGQAIEWTGLQEIALPSDLIFCLQGVTAGAPEPLALLGGRFEVTVIWRTASASGAGHPIALTAESGYFWFFTSANVELIVKVHDACVDPFQRYWVFLAGLTNVEVEVRVRDLLAGFEHVYLSERGTAFQPVLDTTTFATCGAS